ncbi:Uncharacterised protein [Vibrio cholerae]|nr:Uncharacterised protein [Vibrio cholerae]CSI85859.1 Uncharacterised protein [Vibrio cholerae]
MLTYRDTLRHTQIKQRRTERHPECAAKLTTKVKQ